MTEEIHKNDIGTKFLVTVKDGTTAVDISTATEKLIIFKKPDGGILTKTCTFETDGTDGKVFYCSVSGDLNETGSWEIQVSITLSTGTWKSSTNCFIVYGNLGD